MTLEETMRKAMLAQGIDPDALPPVVDEPEPIAEPLPMRPPIPTALASRAYARSSDPGTSHAAAASIPVGELRESQQAVLALLREVGPLTDDEILECYQGRLPWQSPSGLRTRRAELVDAGFVKDTGERRTLRSRRLAIVWAVA